MILNQLNAIMLYKNFVTGIIYYKDVFKNIYKLFNIFIKNWEESQAD